jgi:hypothetical protein
MQALAGWFRCGKCAERMRITRKDKRDARFISLSRSREREEPLKAAKGEGLR